MNIIGRNACRARRNTLGTTRVVFVGAAFLMANLASTILAGADLPAAPPRISHPLLVLKDAAGKNVLESGEPISTRQTCGGCHDYDFITDSFHFQQGKNEMNPKLLASHGIAPFNSSPGMFGKFSIIPNRQLTHAGVADVSDYDMSQPEWLTKCGVCHTGGGISEVDLDGHRFLTPEAKANGPLDPSYTVRDRVSGKVVPWDWAKSGVAESDCFLCHAPKASRGDRREAMAAGNFRWADNATLADTGIVVKQANGSYTYNRAAFNPDGTVKAEALGLSEPTLENCAQCHGFTAKNTTVDPADPARRHHAGHREGGLDLQRRQDQRHRHPEHRGPGEDGLPLGRARGEGHDLHRLPFRAQQPRAHDPDRPDQEPQLPARHERHRRLPQAPGPQLRPRQHPARDREHDAPRHHAGVSRTATTRRRATPSCRTRACTSRRWRARRATSPTSTSGPTAATSGAS